MVYNLEKNYLPRQLLLVVKLKSSMAEYEISTVNIMLVEYAASTAFYIITGLPYSSGSQLILPQNYHHFLRKLGAAYFAFLAAWTQIFLSTRSWNRIKIENKFNLKFVG